MSLFAKNLFSYFCFVLLAGSVSQASQSELNLKTYLSRQKKIKTLSIDLYGGSAKIRKVKDLEAATMVYVQPADKSCEVVIQDAEGIFGFSIERSFMEKVRSAMKCRTELVISVPSDLKIKAEVVNGSVEIEGVDGDHEISAIRSRLSLAQMSGVSKVDSLSSDVEMKAITGEMKFEDISSRLELTKHRDSVFIETNGVGIRERVHSPIGISKTNALLILTVDGIATKLYVE
jgi:hypothetical protein